MYIIREMSNYDVRVLHHNTYTLLTYHKIAYTAATLGYSRSIPEATQLLTVVPIISLHTLFFYSSAAGIGRWWY